MINKHLVMTEIIKHLAGKHNQKTHGRPDTDDEEAKAIARSKANAALYNHGSAIEARFKADFPINKDLQSIRAHGTLLEDIRGVILDHIKLPWIEIDSVDLPDNEVKVNYIKTGNDRYGIFTSRGRAGIPTIKVGVQSQDDWRSIRDAVRETGLIRHPVRERSDKEALKFVADELTDEYEARLTGNGLTMSIRQRDFDVSLDINRVGKLDPTKQSISINITNKGRGTGRAEQFVYDSIKACQEAGFKYIEFADLPLGVVADIGADVILPRSQNSLVASYATLGGHAKEAAEFLDKKYQLDLKSRSIDWDAYVDKYTDYTLYKPGNNIGWGADDVYGSSAKGLASIPHPDYPDVPLFDEFLTDGNKHLGAVLKLNE